ncbi:hypothetical protein AMATHDRAFT_74169 [Amanita thiersii Skay4041]|uniref:Exonuclease domain-containing protein n=1 Tax=Amanita thiersii Skay4041 TaxID=703135 RepID=A0A2A9NXA3_9AGAR|nr:hypothetical protein AMATHDRAFT_74169 [Amanita thiersii Skay4041]
MGCMLVPHTLRCDAFTARSACQASARQLTGQPYDAFLVLDVEATCREGTDLNYPNEIIEFPICLLRWKDSASDGRASKLEIVDEFRSFVKPTWRPTLAKFCTELTGVTQDQVNNAPLFPEVLTLCRQFLVKNGLIDCDTGRHLVTYCWCSDGPFDVRDFVVKQCFISKIVMPEWLQGDVLDIRMAVNNWLNYRTSRTTQSYGRLPTSGITRRSLNISAQLKALGLSEFQGRQHCGIDDCRNISRVLVELARRGISLQPNTVIYPDKRWHWMGKPGQVLDYALT